MWERRRFKRYEASIRAEYMKADGLASIKSLTSTINVSLGGICAAMSEIIREGDELVVKLSLLPEECLATLARVKWVLPESCRLYKCGLEFTWVSSKQLLDEYIALASDMETA
ncbi:MAG: PilZ domain-containing protein [Candidatus Omnitrophota bacterium]